LTLSVRIFQVGDDTAHSWTTTCLRTHLARHGVTLRAREDVSYPPGVEVSFAEMFARRPGNVHP